MPNTIADNLQRLVDARTAIGNAITAKGGTVNTGDGLEEFPADIETIPSGSSTEITGTISGSYVGAGSIAKRFGDIVIIYIYYDHPLNVPANVSVGTVSGLVTTDEFENRTPILAASGIQTASGVQDTIHGSSTTVTASCSNNVISITFSGTGYVANKVNGVKCVVAFKV